jgi:hypothetical protein
MNNYVRKYKLNIDNICCHIYLQQVGDFLRIVSSTNKTDRYDITEILLKVALNIINFSQIIYNVI